MTGMLVAGVVFVIFPVLLEDVSWLRDVLYLGTGLAAIGIGRNPNGVLGGNTPLQRRRDKKAAAAAAAAIEIAEPEQVSEVVHAPS